MTERQIAEIERRHVRRITSIYREKGYAAALEYKIAKCPTLANRKFMDALYYHGR